MTLSSIEQKLLDEINKNARSAATEASLARVAAIETSATVQEHSKQLAELFKRLGSTEINVKQIETRQEDCPAREFSRAANLPGNRSERKANALTWISAGIAIVALCKDQIVEIFKKII